MNFNPLVSIIIPVYNGSDYMKEAIDSALNQTYNNCEVIVVNDGSNDEGKSEVIAKSYSDKIRYFFKENGGVSSAINLGIQKMRGEYFSWLSHDDVYYRNKIEEQINFLKKRKKRNIVLYADIDYIDCDSNSIKGEKTPHIDQDKFRFYLVIKRPLVNGNTVLIPKICFNRVGLFDVSLRTTQDYDMWFRLSKKYDFAYVNKSLAKARIHSRQGCKIIPTFINEVNNTIINQLKKMPKKEILRITNEKNIISVYKKLAVRFSMNGGYKAGWPSHYALNLLRNELDKKGLKLNISFFSIKFICILLELRYVGKRIRCFLKYYDSYNFNI